MLPTQSSRDSLASDSPLDNPIARALLHEQAELVAADCASSHFAAGSNPVSQAHTLVNPHIYRTSAGNVPQSPFGAWSQGLYKPLFPPASGSRLPFHPGEG